MTNTAEIPRAATPLDLKLQQSTLRMDTPDFVTAAAEWLRNRDMSSYMRGFLAIRVENDTKVD